METRRNVQRQPVMLRLDPDVVEKLKRQAVSEDRSLTSLLRYLTRQAVEAFERRERSAA